MGSSSNANAAQAVQITSDLKEINDGEFACNGGAFFWVAFNDINGGWSDAVVAEVSKTAGCLQVGNGVASKTGYEYSDPPAMPSCGVEYSSIAHGVALRRSIMGSPPAMCGVCYLLTGAPDLYDEATYEQQGNTANENWSTIVQVVDTAPNGNSVNGLEYVFDLPNSIFEEGSNPHAGAAGFASGHIPLAYEEVSCPPTAPSTSAPTTAPTPKPTASPAAAPAPSGEECCSFNYSTCDSGWCGDSQENCGVCEGHWILPQEDNSCLAQWAPCLATSTPCCNGLTCQGNVFYKSCQAA